jgi:hypothetical protein
MLFRLSRGDPKVRRLLQSDVSLGPARGYRKKDAMEAVLVTGGAGFIGG